MATQTQNQPINFIPNVPLYTNNVMSEAWRQWFYTLWNRTGGNSNIINNIVENLSVSNAGASADQQIADLKIRISMLEANDATSIALQALESITNVSPTITFGEVMAYGTLGIQ